MTEELPEKRRWFLEQMAESAEKEQWGFELLTKRRDLSLFFKPLLARGFFDATKNPGPVPTEDGKFVQIPYWCALDYLTACARVAAERCDLEVAREIIGVMRDVTMAPSPADNYHTFSKFAEILGILPLEAIHAKTVELIPIWLRSRYDNGLVATELDKGLMNRLVSAADPALGRLAVRILLHCTASRSVAIRGGEGQEVVGIVDDFWLKEFMQHHVESLAKVVPQETTEVFLERTREVYKLLGRASWLSRPAIEEHPQNHEWGGIENRVVEGLRDSLSIWVSGQRQLAEPRVKALLRDPVQIVRRVAIYMVDRQWDTLRAVSKDLLGFLLFSEGHLHEAYSLLKNHFADFSDAEKKIVLAALQKHLESVRKKRGAQTAAYVELQWLSSIAGNGMGPVDARYAALAGNPKVGPPPDHPDFYAYMESWSGPGPTPYRVDELISFSRNGTLVQILNEFHQTDKWRGPSKRALVDTLEEAVVQFPGIFIAQFGSFTRANPAYQHAFLRGFKRLYESGESAAVISWATMWERLVEFFEYVVQLTDDEEGDETAFDLVPTRRWLRTLVAEFIRAGMRESSDPMPIGLLERSWAMLLALLELGERSAVLSEDPMTNAINSERGKVLESIFSQALRMCRFADQSIGEHIGVAPCVTSVFDYQLSECLLGNYEFSTLSGAYLANLLYVDPIWTKENVTRVFPRERPDSLSAAIAGLAYAPARRDLYVLLREAGVIDAALLLTATPTRGRDRLLERFALAYLWGEEELSSSRFGRMFSELLIPDLAAISQFLARVHQQNLSGAQVSRVLDFWRQCLATVKGRPKDEDELLPLLSELVTYIDEATGAKADLLLAVAPFAAKKHGAYSFVSDLLRLVDSNPGVVSNALDAFLTTSVPSYDYKDRLFNLILRLAELGLKEQAIAHTDRLRNLSSFRDLFLRLVDPAASSSGVERGPDLPQVL